MRHSLYTPALQRDSAGWGATTQPRTKGTERAAATARFVVIGSNVLHRVLLGMSRSRPCDGGGGVRCQAENTTKPKDHRRHGRDNRWTGLAWPWLRGWVLGCAGVRACVCMWDGPRASFSPRPRPPASTTTDPRPRARTGGSQTAKARLPRRCITGCVFLNRTAVSNSTSWRREWVSWLFCRATNATSCLVADRACSARQSLPSHCGFWTIMMCGKNDERKDTPRGIRKCSTQMLTPR